MKHVWAFYDFFSLVVYQNTSCTSGPSFALKKKPLLTHSVCYKTISILFNTAWYLNLARVKSFLMTENIKSHLQYKLPSLFCFMGAKTCFLFEHKSAKLLILRRLRLNKPNLYVNNLTSVLLRFTCTAYQWTVRYLFDRLNMDMKYWGK